MITRRGWGTCHPSGACALRTWMPGRSSPGRSLKVTMPDAIAHHVRCQPLKDSLLFLGAGAVKRLASAPGLD